MTENASFPTPDAPAAVVAPLPVPLSPEKQLLGWGLFSRLLSLQAGTLFLVAGVVCFFAYNWADIPAFGKFGLIAGAMVLTGAAAFFRGLHSTAGSLCLLACGLLAGPLLAVYGQVYQTGADAWELFRAWALFLLPLALIGRQNGLWCALWLVGSLWAFLFLEQNIYALGREDEAMRLLLYVSLGQSIFFVGWELAARHLAAPGRAFLYGRWFPRLVGLLLIGYLGMTLMTHIVDEYGHYSYTLAYSLLYGFFIGAGAFWYTRVRQDLFLIACGLLTLIGIVMSLMHRADPSFSNTGWLFLMTLALIGCAAAAGKVLIILHGSMRAQESTAAQAFGEETAEQGWEETAAARDIASSRRSLAFSPERMRFLLTGIERPAAGQDSGQPEEADVHAPWVARILMGICAWIAIPFIVGLMALLFVSILDIGGLLVLSLLLLGAGLALSRAPGIFLQQASLCLCLTGAIAAGVLAALEWHLRTSILLPTIFIFAATAPFAGNAAYRFIAITAAAVLVPLQADLYFGRPYFYAYGGLESGGGAAFFWLPRTLFVCGYAVFSWALAVVWSRRERPSSFERAVRDAGFAVLLILGMLPLLFYKGNMFAWAGLSGGPLFMIGLGAGAGLCIFVWRVTGELEAAVAVRYGLLLFCALLTAASFRLPWLTPGLFALALARHRGSLPLLGTAIVFLAGSTIFEYYCLATSLLSKACSLGGIGIVLLAAGCWLHGRVAALERTEYRHEDAAGKSATAGGQSFPAEQSSRPKGLRLNFGRMALAACLAGFLVLFSFAVRDKETLLAQGKTVVLEIRPVDPRSLMQGDYMVLDLGVEQDIYSALVRNGEKKPADELLAKGIAVLEPDAEGVFRFAGIEGFSVERPDTAKGQVGILYRGKGSRRMQVSSGSFFFQEGHGAAYAGARFAELKVDEEGNSLIVRLLDGQRQPIQPDAKKPE